MIQPTVLYVLYSIEVDRTVSHVSPALKLRYRSIIFCSPFGAAN